jgi:hypothetical protein
VGIVVSVPRTEPEPQAVPLRPGNDVQVQVRDRLAHHVIDQDQRAIGTQAIFDRAFEALRRGEELRYPVGGQVAEQPNMPLRHEEDMTEEKRPVIEERHHSLGLEHGHGRLIAADDVAEGACCWHPREPIALAPPAPGPPP